jgi:hypothetical protein
MEEAIEGTGSPVESVEVVEKTAQQLTEDQQVLKTFNDTLNVFINKVSTYNGAKSQLQRVLINLAVHPLNKEELHFSYPEEKELFELGSTIASSKFFLMLAGLEAEGKLAFNQEALQQVSVSVDINKEEKKEENTNG